MTIPIQPPQHTVTLSNHTVATLHELLALCEEFLRTAGPTVHAELRAYLAQHLADPGWLIDMLGFTGPTSATSSAPTPHAHPRPGNTHSRRRRGEQPDP